MRAAFGPVEAFVESERSRFRAGVRAWTLDEGLSRLYRAECELELDAALAQQVPELLGERVALYSARGAKRRVVHGIVGRYELLDSGTSSRVARIHIVPALAVLEQSVHSRIYSERSLEELVRVLLHGDGLEAWKSCAEAYNTSRKTDAEAKAGPADNASAVDFAPVVLDVEPTPQLCLLQYQESTWAFVERILAAWGLTYLFVHDAEAPCEQLLVVHDTRKLAQRKGAAPTAPLRRAVVASSQKLAEGEGLSSLTWTREPEAQIVLAGNYVAEGSCFVHRPQTTDPNTFSWGVEQPHVLVSPEHHLGVYTARRFAEHPQSARAEAVCNNAPADPLASCELYLQRQGQILVRRKATLAHQDCAGTGNILQLTAGEVLEVAESAGGPYKTILVTSATHSAHSGETGAFEQSFTFLPLELPFAAEVCEGPKLGLQMGRIVGPTDSNVHVDRSGRVLVRLSWEQSDAHHTSHGCWAELGQAWAGAQFGASFFPRVGSQVIVALLEEGPGAPILPVVLGSTYNEVQTPPFGTMSGRFVSGIRTRSIPHEKGLRFNELSFDDSYGTEHVGLRAQHALSTWAGDSHSLVIGASHRPLGWGLRLASLALEHIAGFDEERIELGQLEHDQTISDAPSLGAGPNQSAPGASARTAYLREYRKWRPTIQLARELTQTLIAEKDSSENLLKKLGQRNANKLCDLLTDLALRSFVPRAPVKSLLLQASRLVRLALAIGLQPRATFDSSVYGSHKHEVSGPSEEKRCGGIKTTIGVANSPANVLTKQAAQAALLLANMPGSESRHKKAGQAALQLASMPASEWRRKKIDAAHKPYIADTLVHGDSRTSVRGNLVTDVDKAGHAHLVNGPFARSGGSRITKVANDDVSKVLGQQRLYVRKQATWWLHKLLLTVRESLNCVVEDAISWVTRRGAITLRAAANLELEGKHVIAKAGRYARIDGRIVSLKGARCVRLEQEGASITLRNGNVYIEGRNVVIRGERSVDIRGGKVDIR